MLNKSGIGVERVRFCGIPHHRGWSYTFSHLPVLVINHGRSKRPTEDQCLPFPAPSDNPEGYHDCWYEKPLRDQESGLMLRILWIVIWIFLQLSSSSANFEMSEAQTSPDFQAEFHPIIPNVVDGFLGMPPLC